MDTKALRQKVLDLAIRGKLVPQDPNDEPASVLLERIRQEKQQMVKDGKLKAKDIKNDSIIFKGEDNLHYEKFDDGTIKCIEDEIPFEIPDTWNWCRLCVIGSTNIGLTYSPNDISDNGVIVLRSSNIINGRINYSDLVRVTTTIKENEFLNTNDILLCARNGSKRLVGKCALINDAKEPLSFGAFMAVYRSNFNKYIIHFLNTETFRHTFITDDSKQINQLTQEIIKRTLLPLPPINEQERIAIKVNSLLTIIDDIEHQNEDIACCIENTKAKILDLAIKGKLVPQNPDDEPASVLLERIRAEKEELIKQGKIKRDKNESVIFKGEDNSYYEKIDNSVVCIDDELPYEIPEKWTYIRLKDVLEYEQPTPYIVDSTAYCNDYETPVLTAGKSFVIGYTNETKGIKNDLPVIIFDDFTTESKYVDFPFKVKSSAMKILTADERVITTLYAYYAMQIVECDSENHKRYWISEFSEKIIGLPPLEEQFRIINKINEIESLFE